MKKKLVLLAAGLGLVVSMNAQTLYVPNGTGGIGTSANGNVGIGITNPNFKLTVQGEIGINMLYPYVQFNSIYWNANSFIQTGVTAGTLANGDYMVFYNPAQKGFNFSQGGYNAMTIHPNGKIGIGTTTPSALLQVGNSFSDIGSPTVRIFTSAGGAGTVVDALHIDTQNSGNYDQGVAISLGWENSVYGAYTSRIVHYGYAAGTVGSKLQFQTHSNSQGNWNTGIIIDELGKVGIGTTNPYAAILHVDKAALGDIGGSIFISNTASSAVGNRSRLGFDLVGFDDIIPTASIDGVLSNTNGTSDLIFNAYDGNTLITYEKMRILGSNGNILIGKTSQNNPAYKLDVAGSIRANEIKVNTTGADFVFEPTYKLRSLAEVETFINQHKHLPDVAPAAEMQTNGVSMGEMQAKLLQKVEELTLYSIEQEKQLQEQKTQLQEQRQSNTDVRQQLVEQAKQNAELKQEIEQLKLLITQKLK